MLIDNLGGTLLIGLTVSLYSYGLITAQAGFYFINYHATDSMSLKVWVSVLWLLITVYVVLLSLSVYVELVVQVHMSGSSYSYQWSPLLSTAFILNLLIVVLVQIHFAHKIQKLLANRYRSWIVIPLLVLFFVRFVSGIATILLLGPTFTSASGNGIVVLEDGIGIMEPVVLMYLISTILADIGISACLWVLINPRETAMMSSTTRYAVVRLMMFAGRRCIIIVILAGVEFGFILSRSSIISQGTFFGLECSMAGVYLESFLLNLNARRVLRSGHQPWEDTMEDTMELRDIEGLGQSNRNDEPGPVLQILSGNNKSAKITWPELVFGGGW